MALRRTLPRRSQENEKQRERERRKREKERERERRWWRMIRKRIKMIHSNSSQVLQEVAFPTYKFLGKIWRTWRFREGPEKVPLSLQIWRKFEKGSNNVPKKSHFPCKFKKKGPHTPFENYKRKHRKVKTKQLMHICSSICTGCFFQTECPASNRHSD